MEFVSSQRTYANHCPGLCHQASCGEANAAACAGNDRDLALELICAMRQKLVYLPTQHLDKLCMLALW
jgi:hypothetical protein